MSLVTKAGLQRFFTGLKDRFAPISHKHTKSQITDFPSSLPASDVSAWAKAASKPSYTKAEVGLGNVDNVKQYSVNNPPPYPVTSVNGKTGAVTVPSVNVPSTTSLIKGNGSGGLVAATRGSDYIASGNIVKQTLVASESTPTDNYAINWVYG